MTSTSAKKNSTKYFEPSTSFDQSNRNNFLTNNDVKIQPEWDMFRLLPPKSDGIEDGILITLHYLSILGYWHYIFLQFLKIASFFLLFFITLGSAILAKSTLLLMISGINSAEKNVFICTDKIPGTFKNFVVY